MKKKVNKPTKVSKTPKVIKVVKIKPNYTSDEFAYKVDAEGLSYSIIDYFNRDISKEVADTELVELWAQAYDILVQIQDKLDDALEHAEELNTETEQLNEENEKDEEEQD